MPTPSPARAPGPAPGPAMDRALIDALWKAAQFNGQVSVTFDGTDQSLVWPHPFNRPRGHYKLHWDGPGGLTPYIRYGTRGKYRADIVAPQGPLFRAAPHPEVQP